MREKSKLQRTGGGAQAAMFVIRHAPPAYSSVRGVMVVVVEASSAVLNAPAKEGRSAREVVPLANRRPLGGAA